VGTTIRSASVPSRIINVSGIWGKGHPATKTRKAVHGDPASPPLRGTLAVTRNPNENTNELPRQYLPKRTDPSSNPSKTSK
jgi:hypothetical protein